MNPAPGYHLFICLTSVTKKECWTEWKVTVNVVFKGCCGQKCVSKSTSYIRHIIHPVPHGKRVGKICYSSQCGRKVVKIRLLVEACKLEKHVFFESGSLFRCKMLSVQRTLLDVCHAMHLDLSIPCLFTDILQYYLTCSVGQINPFQQVIIAFISFTLWFRFSLCLWVFTKPFIQTSHTPHTETPTNTPFQTAVENTGIFNTMLFEWVYMINCVKHVRDS